MIEKEKGTREQKKSRYFLFMFINIISNKVGDQNK